MITKWQNRFTLNLISLHSASMCCTKETPILRGEGMQSKAHQQEPSFQPCHGFPAPSRLFHHAGTNGTVPILAKWNVNLLKTALLFSEISRMSKFWTVDGSHPLPQQVWEPSVCQRGYSWWYRLVEHRIDDRGLEALSWWLCTFSLQPGHFWLPFLVTSVCPHLTAEKLLWYFH